MNLNFITSRGEFKLNPFLVAQKKLRKSDIAHIVGLHIRKDLLLDEIEETGDRGILKKIEEVEYQLQDAWGFTRNSMYHKHWEIPGCSCGPLDNLDAYPYMKYYSGACKLHKHLLDL